MRSCFGLLMLIVLTNSLDALPLTIYYEALCSDSVDFITKQLYPNYNDLKDHLTIEFIPYGKAMHSFNNKTLKYVFSCQHGPMECKGNKFQACALDQIDEQDRKVNFVHCVMKSKNPSNMYYIETCATENNLDFTKVAACVASKQSDKLLAANGDKTWSLEPNLYYVPTIILNNSLQINQPNQRQALYNLKALVCDHINEPKPEICSNDTVLRKIRNFFF